VVERTRFDAVVLDKELADTKGASNKSGDAGDSSRAQRA
jgi:hypothetical protein